MTWLEVDHKCPRPSFTDTARAVREMAIQPVPDNDESVDVLLQELRATRSEALFAKFHVSGSKDLDWYASRNRWDDLGFAPAFLSHPEVCQCLPALTKRATLGDKIAFKSEDALTLDGILARVLISGGAYAKYQRGAREAKRIGALFCGAVFQDRFDDVEVLCCWDAWSAWFCDVAWDMTIVIIDRRHQHVSLLCSTDTD